MEKFVIALGGSIAFPEKINTAFIRKFYSFVKEEVKNQKKFIIISGGGYTARKYQKSLAETIKASNNDKDWMGIRATRLNAYFLKTVFKKEASPVLFDERFKVKGFGKYKIIIGSGWKPGWSTDFVAVQTAVDFNIKNVIMLGSPNYVYTGDFEKDKNAKPILSIAWKDYRKIIPSKWRPGIHAPVDPVAAKLAQKEKVKVIVAGGKDLNNLKKILKGEKFKGTVLF